MCVCVCVCVFADTRRCNCFGCVWVGVAFVVDHGRLLLPFEEAMTRKVNGEYYNLGAHMLWIGDRTRHIDGAHVEYFGGIRNPIGLKCGPTLDADDLSELVLRLNPDKVPGRITLITRYGAGKVADLLPGHIEAVQRTGVPVVWSCDPMHGNTYMSEETGLKTRHFDEIYKEIGASFDIHGEQGGLMGGVHLELTGDNVTECLGGSQELAECELSKVRTEARCHYCC